MDPAVRIYHPYTAWEDWQAGMWSRSRRDGDTARAAHILGDPDTFRDAARAMLRDWPRSAEQNLTGGLNNRRAWVGQAACCHLAGVPEDQTRDAWWTLTDAERRTANQIADDVIIEWLHDRGPDPAPDLFDLIPEPRVSPEG